MNLKLVFRCIRQKVLRTRGLSARMLLHLQMNSTVAGAHLPPVGNVSVNREFRSIGPAVGAVGEKKWKHQMRRQRIRREIRRSRIDALQIVIVTRKSRYVE